MLYPVMLSKLIFICWLNIINRTGVPGSVYYEWQASSAVDVHFLKTLK